MKQVIKCGSFFSAVDQSVQKDIAITVEGNKITKICPVCEADTTDATVIDLSDKFVMPGLIDAHMHMGMNGEPTMVPLHFKKAADVAYEAMVYAKRDLLAGFTTVRAEGDYGFVDVALRDAITKGLCEGPRICTSGIPISSTGGHGDNHFGPHIPAGGEMASICNGPDEVRAATRYTFKHGADQVKLMATGGVMSHGDEPGAPEMTFEEMKAACDVAKFRGKLSSAHAHGAEGIKNAIRAGITSIEHGMLIDEEGIDMLVEYGTYLIPTIIAAYRIVEFGEKAGIDDYAVRKAALCLENHAEHLKMMVKKGVKIGFGTDTGTPFSPHGAQAFEFELMVNSGIPAAYCLQSATKVNAEMMKMPELGTLEEGKLADIVAFAGNPLEDNMKSMMNCTFVMKDGVVYKN